MEDITESKQTNNLLNTLVLSCRNDCGEKFQMEKISELKKHEDTCDYSAITVKFDEDAISRAGEPGGGMAPPLFPPYTDFF